MGKKRHVFDILSVLTLMMLFAFLALSVALTGTSVYSRTSQTVEKNSFTRTSALYLQQKLRRADGEAEISVSRIGESDALILTHDYDGEKYSTYIYCHDGWLMEVLAPDGILPAPESGQKLTELSSFKIESNAQLSLLQFELGDADGQTETLAVNIRSGFSNATAPTE